MRYIFLLILLFVFLNADAKIFYVSIHKHGDGSSWDQASSDLFKILKQSQSGDEVWIAQGVYFPSKTDRNLSFILKRGVKIYGGFVGFETSVSDRRYPLPLSVLSGNIGSPQREDNSYTVLYSENLDSTNVIDGIRIQDGYAVSEEEDITPRNSGGGWFNKTNQPNQEGPKIIGVSFVNNTAVYGAAYVHKVSESAESNENFTQCFFERNYAFLDGGALYISIPLSQPGKTQFDACQFNYNHANYGGAVFVQYLNCELVDQFKNCTFNENSAESWGGAIYLYNQITEELYKNLTGFRFSGNSPSDINKISLIN